MDSTDDSESGNEEFITEDSLEGSDDFDSEDSASSSSCSSDEEDVTQDDDEDAEDDSSDEDDGIDESNILDDSLRSGSTSASSTSSASSSSSSSDETSSSASSSSSGRYKRRRVILDEDDDDVEEISSDEDDEDEDDAFSQRDQRDKIQRLDALAEGVEHSSWSQNFLFERDGMAYALCARLAALLNTPPPFVMLSSSMGPHQPCVIKYRGGSFPAYISLNSQMISNERAMRSVCFHAMQHWYEYTQRLPHLARGYDAASGVEAAIKNECHAHNSKHYLAAGRILAASPEFLPFPLDDVTIANKIIVACKGCGAYFLSSTKRTDLQNEHGLKHDRCPMDGRFHIFYEWKSGFFGETTDSHHPPNVNGFLKSEAALLLAAKYAEDEIKCAPYEVNEPKHSVERERYYKEEAMQNLRCFQYMEEPKYKRGRSAAHL